MIVTRMRAELTALRKQVDDLVQVIQWQRQIIDRLQREAPNASPRVLSRPSRGDAADR